MDNCALVCVCVRIVGILQICMGDDDDYMSSVFKLTVSRII